MRGTLPVSGREHRFPAGRALVATTDANGFAVLAPVTAGTRTITVSGPFAGGTFNVTVAATTMGSQLLHPAATAEPSGAEGAEGRGTPRAR